jgi:UDP-GlcNAc:undecaprenyl-phosphate/decaprenyl-phosphate GlcNAc-1-phosphate transferase
MLINYTFIAASAFLLNAVFVFLLKRISLRRGFLCSGGLPRIGGIAVGLSFVLTSAANLSLLGMFTKEAAGLLIASAVMLIFGMIDDRRELSIVAKFATQVVCIALLVLFGVRTRIIYIGDAANTAITALWVLGITNAFNHLDIMDGLAGGIALILSFAFLALSTFHGHAAVIVMALALAGATTSFLMYNLPPAKIYLGNSGSHFLGFVLAAVAMLISYAPMERKIALASPILILGFPILDTAFLVFMRMIKKRSVFKKSNDHIAFRLLKKGHSKNKTLFFMLGFTLIYSLLGILITQTPNLVGIIVVCAAAAASFFAAQRMGSIAIDG